MSRAPFQIPDAVVLQFLENVDGIDVAAARARIAKTVAIADDHDAAISVTSNGFRFWLSGSLVTRIAPLRTAKQTKQRAR